MMYQIIPGFPQVRGVSIIQELNPMTDTIRTTTASLAGDTYVSGIGDSERSGVTVAQEWRPSESASLKLSCQEHQEREHPSVRQGVITIPHEQCAICHDFFLKTSGYFYRGEFMCADCAWMLAENGEFYCG